MLFNSLEFFLFFPAVFLLYWALNNTRLVYQNIVLLVSSYVFYGWWDWRFLFLIVISTLGDYYIGKELGKKHLGAAKRKLWLYTSLVLNLGILGFFKYYNFFVDSFIAMFQTIGLPLQHTWTLNVILPVGISFYTFQTLSYTIDVYRKKMAPTKSLTSFAVFVAFFPQLVAGPIERASNMLSQINAKRQFRYGQAGSGIKLMLYGLFKKVAIADSLAPLVDDIFLNYGTMPSGTLLLGILFFSLQIYCDFSGYSDIAIGCAKLFGFELMSNFKFPYFSRNVAEFWRRWHISLSSWFKDYLYIPLGGSTGKTTVTLRNIFIVFLVSGLWHGANWTFVIWGGIHAMLFLPLYLTKTNRKYIDTGRSAKNHYNLADMGRAGVTFFMVSLAWIFFRAPDVETAWNYFLHIFTQHGTGLYQHPLGYRMVDYYVLIIVFFIYEMLVSKDERDPIPFKSAMVRALVYILLCFGLLLFYDGGANRSFLYFQF
ncbi:MBOAT family O-acyltransferase [Maribacter sp. 2307ULW6-5]|uniref:MBOAT family O-acyltransferase n=1 Tax=Maribacter sp. 2307ULW6-5 TaxID=3386275 RepID=UPI0039BCBD01